MKAFMSGYAIQERIRVDKRRPLPYAEIIPRIPAEMSTFIICVACRFKRFVFALHAAKRQTFVFNWLIKPTCYR